MGVPDAHSTLKHSSTASGQKCGKRTCVIQKPTWNRTNDADEPETRTGRCLRKCHPEPFSRTLSGSPTSTSLCSCREWHGAHIIFVIANTCKDFEKHGKHGNLKRWRPDRSCCFCVVRRVQYLALLHGATVQSSPIQACVLFWRRREKGTEWDSHQYTTGLQLLRAHNKVRVTHLIQSPPQAAASCADTGVKKPSRDGRSGAPRKDV